MRKASSLGSESSYSGVNRSRLKSQSLDMQPHTLRDQLIESLDKAKGKLEASYKALEGIISKPCYQQLNNYAEQLLDVIYTGDLLDSDAKLRSSAAKLPTNYCIFRSPQELNVLRVYVQLIKRLRRRHKKLNGAFELHAENLLTSLGSFEESARRRLALVTSLFLIDEQLKPRVLLALGNNPANIDAGVTLEFLLLLCDTLKREKDSAYMLQVLRVSGLDGKILHFMPPMMRSDLYFRQVYQEHKLDEVVKLYETHAGQALRRELLARLIEDLREKQPHVNVLMNVRQFQRKHHMSDSEIIGVVWQGINSIHVPMPSGKPSSLPASASAAGLASQTNNPNSSLDRMLRKLHAYAPVLNGICSTDNAQIALLVRLQEWCHEHNPLFKQFERLVVPLYQAGVFSEEAILRWYEVEHVEKGTPAFLDQMHRFVQWLHSNEDARLRVDYNTYVANRKSKVHRNPTVYSDSVPGNRPGVRHTANVLDAAPKCASNWSPRPLRISECISVVKWAED